MLRKIIRGALVNPDQIRRARELRRHLTPEEKILWQELRGSRLDVHFQRQQLIAGYIADFYCHSAGLAVELDGSGHDQQRGYDRLRDLTFAKLGIQTLRFTNQRLRNELDAVLNEIRATVNARKT